MKQFDYYCKIPSGKLDECIKIQNEFINYCKENDIEGRCRNETSKDYLMFYTTGSIVRLRTGNHETALIPLDNCEPKEIDYEKMLKKINKFMGKGMENELNIENFGKELVELFNKYKLKNFEVNSYINDYPKSEKHQINIEKKNGGYTEGAVAILIRDFTDKKS